MPVHDRGGFRHCSSNLSIIDGALNFADIRCQLDHCMRHLAPCIACGESRALGPVLPVEYDIETARLAPLVIYYD